MLFTLRLERRSDEIGNSGSLVPQGCTGFTGILAMSDGSCVLRNNDKICYSLGRVNLSYHKPAD